MDKIKEYLNRILPVVGDTFRSKRVAIINPSWSCLIADALARCGLKKQWHLLADLAQINSPLVLSFGQKYVGVNSGEAMALQITQHNTFEKSWEIEVVTESDPAILTKLLTENQVDLVVGGGSLEDCQLINQLSRQTNIPAVFFLLLTGLPVQSVVCVTHPDLPNNFEEVLGLIPQDKVLNSLSSNHHLPWLEAADLAMNFTKAMLLRGTSYQREDLEDLFFNQQRTMILRGQANWPWWVGYLNPIKKKSFLEKLFATTAYLIPPPIEALAKERVMVIGCGTGSLIIGELVNYFRHLLMVDCKSFSVYNPVRQLIGTSWIDRGLKPFVLQEVLRERLGPQAAWQKTETSLIRTYSNSTYSIGAAELHLTEDNPESIDKFKALLDEFQPTLVIVAMGKTYDDNFVACEILRKRGIKHIIPSAFTGATHFKTVIVDGENGPCYECMQNNLSVDVGAAVELNQEAREMFYTDPDDPTQPATIFETWPSAHSVVRLAVELALPVQLRASWFTGCLEKGKTCFVGGNLRALDEFQESNEGSYLYGVAYPGQVVVYGVEDIARLDESYTCLVCGKQYSVSHRLELKEDASCQE